MLLFASDIHLSAAEPAVAARFLRFLHGPVRCATGLYLLGDLFEAWVGDDELDSANGNSFALEIVNALRGVTDQGIPIFFLPGNRDFLIGEGFTTATGIVRLTDPHVLSVPTWQFVLSHGDLLCSDDAAYQDFRMTVRSPGWQMDFLARPLAARRQIVDDIRARSEASKAQHRRECPAIMDVNLGTVDDFLRDNGYATLIHGHTHRPGRHDHLVDGIHCERWVLGDWHPEYGDYLAWSGSTLTRHKI